LAILLAAGTGGVLNAWHATVERTVVPGGGHELPSLPGEFGLLVGLEPIALILVLSHLVGLVLTASAGDGQATTVVVTAGGAGDRQAASPAPARPTAGAATTGGAGDRATAGTPPRRPAPAARGSLHAVPAVRQGWMTEDLIGRVVASMAVAQRRGETYGRPRLMREHGLTIPLTTDPAVVGAGRTGNFPGGPVAKPGSGVLRARVGPRWGPLRPPPRAAPEISAGGPVMAGHRRVRGPAADAPTVRSTAVVLRAGRIRDEARGRYVDAQSPRERLVVAVDYVRSGEAAGHRAGVADLDELITVAARTLMGMGDELIAALAERGRGR